MFTNILIKSIDSKKEDRTSQKRVEWICLTFIASFSKCSLLPQLDFLPLSSQYQIKGARFPHLTSPTLSDYRNLSFRAYFFLNLPVLLSIPSHLLSKHSCFSLYTFPSSFYTFPSFFLYLPAFFLYLPVLLYIPSHPSVYMSLSFFLYLPAFFLYLRVILYIPSRPSVYTFPS